jgi:hypothetical protein
MKAGAPPYDVLTKRVAQQGTQGVAQSLLCKLHKKDAHLSAFCQYLFADSFSIIKLYKCVKEVYTHEAT